MRYLIFILLFILGGFVSKAQLPSSTIITQKSTGTFEHGWDIHDSANVSAVRDTFYARFNGTRILRQVGPDSSEWFYIGNRHWLKNLTWKDTLTQLATKSEISGFGQNFLNTNLRQTGFRSHNSAGQIFLWDSLSTTLVVGRGRNASNTNVTQRTSWNYTPDAATGTAMAGFTGTVRNVANTTDSLGHALTVFTNSIQLQSVNTITGASTRIRLKPDTVFIKGALAAASADSILGFGPLDPTTGEQVMYKIPIPSASVGLTSVGLSMPSAFTVTNSPLTSNGTLNVIGAGTTLQYIRGNGTLATFDTTAIPSFSVKVRSLFSGTSPIVYANGAISILDATTTQKGAASFNASHFTVSSAAVSLSNVITAGSCTSCDLSFTADGRLASASNGSGGGGLDTANNGLMTSLDTVQLNRNILLTHTADLRVDYNNYFIDGVNGSNLNNGLTEATPRKTISSVNDSLLQLSEYYDQSRLGIKYNSYLHEQFQSFGQIKIGAWGLDGAGYIVSPAINGADSAGVWTDSSTLYKQTWTHDIGLGNPDYNYIFVIEIDTAMEKYAPFSARRYLNVASSIANCNSTPGTCFTPDVTVNPITVYVHTSNSSNPNNNSKYRYEIVKREFCFDARLNSQWPNNLLENLWLLNSGHGYGMVGTGDSTFISKCVLQGGGTHNAVVASGIIDRNVWLPGPHLATGNYTIVSYASDATGNKTRYTNNIFFDSRNEIYAHESIGSFADEIVVDGNYFFGDTTNDYSSGAFTFDNLYNGYFTNNYVYGYQVAFGGLTLNQRYENNVWNRISGRSGVNYPIDYDLKASFKNNLLVMEGDANGLGMYGIQFNQVANKGVIENSIFHTRAAINANIYFGSGGGSPDQYKSYRNIFIVENAPGINSTIVTTTKGNGTPAPASIGYKGDSNIYIIVSGTLMWEQNTPNFAHSTIQTWRDSTGQDLNSIQWFASQYPNGLKTFFVDPEHGNYTIASTPQGDSIKALMAGMTSPPTFFPRRPSYEAAVESILHPGGPSDAWKSSGSGDVVQPGDFIQNQSVSQQDATAWINSLKIQGTTLDLFSSGGNGLRITSGNTASALAIKNSNVSGFAGIQFNDNADAVKAFIAIGNGTSTLRFGTPLSSVMDFEIGFGSPKMRLSSSGNLLTGTIGSEAGGYSLQNNGGFLQNGAVTINVGSDATGDIFYRNSGTLVARLGIGSDGQVLTVSSGLPSWQNASVGTTLYSGDDALAGDRIVTGSNNDLTFATIDRYRINSNYFALSKNDATRIYTGYIGATAANAWQFAYTPAAVGSFTRGVGLYVDTLNNVGLGDMTQTTMPLYSTGNSVYVNGLQSRNGNFYAITNVSGNITATLQQYFFVIDASGGNVTITLPAASTAFGASMGIHYIFKRIDNSINSITIQRAGSDTIDGATSFTLITQYEVKEVQCISTSAWAIQ